MAGTYATTYERIILFHRKNEASDKRAAIKCRNTIQHIILDIGNHFIDLNAETDTLRQTCSSMQDKSTILSSDKRIN